MCKSEESTGVTDYIIGSWTLQPLLKELFNILWKTPLSLAEKIDAALKPALITELGEGDVSLIQHKDGKQRGKSLQNKQQFVALEQMMESDSAVTRITKSQYSWMLFGNE